MLPTSVPVSLTVEQRAWMYGTYDGTLDPEFALSEFDSDPASFWAAVVLLRLCGPEAIRGSEVATPVPLALPEAAHVLSLALDMVAMNGDLFEVVDFDVDDQGHMCGLSCPELGTSFKPLRSLKLVQ